VQRERSGRGGRSELVYVEDGSNQRSAGMPRMWAAPAALCLCCLAPGLAKGPMPTFGYPRLSII
jgi:hypothetical protein